MIYKRACEIAAAFDHNLNASTDFFNTVRIQDKEGTFFIYDHAFLADVGDEFIAVFSEHNPWRVFAKEDLVRYTEFEEVQTIRQIS